MWHSKNPGKNRRDKNKKGQPFDIPKYFKHALDYHGKLRLNKVIDLFSKEMSKRIS
jgi:hypothetical protein